MPEPCFLCRIELDISDIPGIEFAISDQEALVIEIADESCVNFEIAQDTPDVVLLIEDDADMLDLEFGDIVILGGTSPIYSGPTVFTPSPSVQEAETGGYLMRENIVINPIPQNYGLITYNGSFITVS